MNAAYKYPGQELDLFQYAKNWKKYFSKHLKPFIKGKVLEAGAGTGSNTPILNDGSAPQWMMLEPDAAMAAALEKDVTGKKYPANCNVKQGTVVDMEQFFDTIIYIDVLEHIEADAEELKKAASLLNKGGHLIVLSPAFPYLYSPFDKAIGHCRRYNIKTLKKITPPGLSMIRCRYYDSIGFFASLMNKTLLKQKMPTLNQVLFWDRWMVPVSAITDKLFLHGFGKSIIAVWEK
jgi:SAM-dependent methyltransferase